MLEFFNNNILPFKEHLDKALADTPQYRYIPPKVVKIHQIDVTYVEQVDEFVPSPIDRKRLTWKPF